MQLKTWNQLTTDQQKAAIQMRVHHLVQAISEGRLTFNNPAMQEKVLHAAKRAEDMKTPWFFGQYVMEGMASELATLATAECASAFYIPRDINVMMEPEL